MADRQTLKRLLVYGTLATAACVAIVAALTVGELIHPRAMLRGMLPPPTHVEWQTVDPPSEAMDRAKLAALTDSLATRGTRAFLVLRGGQIVQEWYASGEGPTTQYHTASLAKSLVGGMALLVALGDGRLDLDEPASKYIPAWKANDLKSRITVRHLATHTSGLEDARDADVARGDETGWKGEYWRNRSKRFAIAIEETPVLHEPGSQVSYSNPGLTTLAYAITKSLQGAADSDIRALLARRIMEPLDIPPDAWSISYGEEYHADGMKLFLPEGGGRFTARSVARIGQLMLARGQWNGAQLLPAESIVQATNRAVDPEVEIDPGHPSPGLCWWTNSDGAWPELPPDAFAGAGHRHQLLVVIPSLDMIIVRFGTSLGPDAPPHVGDSYWDDVREHLFQPLMEATANYPPTMISWAPASTIVRRAEGSDNWPITWADDDQQYTAYGDGWGFEPKVTEKLSLGLARISGSPENFSGVNLRSATVEQYGDNYRGKKASGILMVDGTLYVWARNAGNSQLAWSLDRGHTWHWADWKFSTSFGCPTFLNFGPNYDGARDDYVYIYSFDSDNAYDPANRMVLARVPKDRITRRLDYEFFTRIDEAGQPEWISDIVRRGAVFRNQGRCFRGGVSYNAGVGRYYWAQITPADDSDTPNGLAIYEATEPWGPWTIVYRADPWDVDPGESAWLPTKWMSDDGRTIHLVFSGDDSFCVRKGTLHWTTDNQQGIK